MNSNLPDIPRQLKVAMVVDNAIIGDSRVIKSAEAVAAFGHEVTLFGIDFGIEHPVIPGVNVKLIPIVNPKKKRGKKKRGKSSLLKRMLHPLVSVVFFASYESKEVIIAQREKLNTRRISIKEANGKNTVEGIILLLKFYPRLTIHQLRKKLSVMKNKANRKIILIFNRRRTLKAMAQKQKRPGFQPRPRSINWMYEEAFVQAITDFEPDVIHTHDYKCVSIGALVKEQLLSKDINTFWIYDAHEFLPGLVHYSAEWLELQCQNERNYIQKADCVITVSSEIADLLKKTHFLTNRPVVVLNAPVTLEATNTTRDLRIDSNVGNEVLLGIYVGGVTPIRGLDVIIPALEAIEELHITLLTRNDVNVETMQSLADASGVGDRLHVVDYVSPNEIVQFISAASFGIAPYLHLLNQEISLPSKFYEYACANLPIVGSDVAVVKSVLERTNVGEVFEAGNAESFKDAVLKISSNLQNYRDNYVNSEFMNCTWENQIIVLSKIYQTIAEQGT